MSGNTISIAENMAPFDQFIFHHSPIHPVHVTLQDQQHGLRSLVSTIQDPYYSSNVQPFVKHRNVFAPHFDVRETDEAYFLEGEFPGIGAKEDILIEKLGPRTLLVETKQEHFDVERGWEEFAPKIRAHEDSVSNSNSVNGKDEKHDAHGHKNNDIRAEEGPFKSILTERHVGTAQRSFTFPSQVDIGGLKARLRHGLLVMMVPKARGGKEEDSKRILVED